MSKPMNQTAAHPALRPEGFRPLIDGKAARDRRLVNTMLDAWEAEGFAQVAPINVDFSDVLLAGHSQGTRSRAFRFMDPASGQMLALLSDVTHGIARLARGELASATRPLKLSYEGQAIRASGSATRPTRQFGQVGVEIIGFNQGNSGTPLEMISLAIKSLQGLGLRSLSLTLVDPPLAETLIENELPGLSPNQRQDLAQALDRKDEGKIKSLAGSYANQLIGLMRGASAQDPRLVTLTSLKCDLENTFDDAEVRVTIEPFEQRGFAFQAGPSFAIYADKISGELGRGGMYELDGEPCFGFTLYRDTLISALSS